VPFGRSLTSLPELPAGAKRDLADPLAERRSLWIWILILALLAGALLAVGPKFRAFRKRAAKPPAVASTPAPTPLPEKLPEPGK